MSISVNMQMSARSRIIDLLPILVVFAVVTAFATYLVVDQVVREPLVVPAPRTTPADELPQQVSLSDPGELALRTGSAPSA